MRVERARAERAESDLAETRKRLEVERAIPPLDGLGDIIAILRRISDAMPKVQERSGARLGAFAEHLCADAASYVMLACDLLALVAAGDEHPFRDCVRRPRADPDDVFRSAVLDVLEFSAMAMLTAERRVAIRLAESNRKLRDALSRIADASSADFRWAAGVAADARYAAYIDDGDRAEGLGGAKAALAKLRAKPGVLPSDPANPWSMAAMLLYGDTPEPEEAKWTRTPSSLAPGPHSGLLDPQRGRFDVRRAARPRAPTSAAGQ